jgi:uncharacterized protein (DUF58 family)
MDLTMNTPTPEKKLILNARLVPAICCLLVVLYLVDSYRGWSVLLIGFGGAWLVSYFWARSLARGLSLVREMRFGWAQVGDHLEERFTLVNRSRFPALWVEILDETNMPNYWANQVRGINPDSESRWYVRSVCSQRGLYVFGPTYLRTRDPFGFYTVTIFDPTSTTMMVMPPIVNLPTIQVAPGGRAGEGSIRVNAPERTVNSSGVRKYVPGDSLRWIHWRTSVRRNDLYVRVFDGAPAGDWWIILDLESSSQVGSGQDSTLEHGIILAASLANLGMRSGRSVGLIAYGEDIIWLPPNMSDDQNWHILRSLALIKPGNQPLSKVLEFAQPVLGQNTSLILITPSVKGEWLEPLMAVRNQQVVPTVLLFDPLTFGGSQPVQGMSDQLTSLGVVHDVIVKSLLEQGEAQPGRAGKWEWRITPLGRAIPMLAPDELVWRNISMGSSQSMEKDQL